MKIQWRRRVVRGGNRERKSISNVQAYVENPNRGKLDGAFVGNNNIG